MAYNCGFIHFLLASFITFCIIYNASDFISFEWNDQTSVKSREELYAKRAEQLETICKQFSKNSGSLSKKFIEKDILLSLPDNVKLLIFETNVVC